MPVRFQGKDASELFYLIPAPFVDINKTFDKQGDGEILGSRYSIQLKGYIVADRGSPKTDGSFIDDGVDVIDLETDVEGGSGKTGWYESLQNKQKALSNLISKVQDGAYLEILPLDESMAGFSSFVRLERVDLPTHNPGDPYKAEYTINLSCDYILGPTDVANDEDDWFRQDKWLVSAASENWSIVESDKFVLERDLSNSSVLTNSKKAFELTRTISATGKNRFDDETGMADGLDETDKFSQLYAENGKAWQQARGYLYDIVKYGNKFLFGANNTEYTGGVPLPSPEIGDGDPDDYHLFVMNLPVVSDHVSNEINDLKQYKAFNYRRTQSVDTKGGSFTVNETWMLMPSSAIVTETMEFTTQEDPSTGVVTISVNGSIEGLSDNADDVGVGDVGNEDKKTTRKEPVDEVFNYLGVSADEDEDILAVRNSKYQNALSHYNQVVTSLYITAQNIVNDIKGYTQLTVNPIPTSKTATQQPGNGIITYSASFTTDNGNFGNFIPYVRKEEFSVSDTYPGQVYAEHVVLGRKLGPVLQDIGTQTHWLREVSISCNVDVNREFLCVNSHDDIMSLDTKADCIIEDNIGEFDGTCSLAANTNKVDCLAARDEDAEGGIWTASKFEWIFNPNYINLGTSNARVLTVGSLGQGTGATMPGSKKWTTDIIRAKPGSAPDVAVGDENTINAAEPLVDDAVTDGEDFNVMPNDVWEFEPYEGRNYAKRKQYVAIKKLLNSLDPLTYLHADFDGNLQKDQHVTKRFTNAPQENWNPKTGAWSYSISWIYEIDHPYTTAASSFFDGTFDDGRYLPDKQKPLTVNEGEADPLSAALELPRTAPGQNF